MSNPTGTYNFRNERLDAVLEQSMKLHGNGVEVVLKFKIDFSGVYAVGIVVPDTEKGCHAFDKNHFAYSLINGEKGYRIELAIPFPPDDSKDSYDVAGGTFDTKHDIPTRFYKRSKNANKARVEIDTKPESSDQGDRLGIYLTCFSCNTVTKQSIGCGNCNGLINNLSISSEGGYGVFCCLCRIGFTEWTCGGCGEKKTG